MELKHQAVSARKWRTAIRQVETHFRRGLPAVLFLTDPARTPDPVSIVSRLPRGSGIIYRHFGADDRRRIASALSEKAKSDGHVLLIAADPDLARAVDADGVHWPEARLDEARAWRGRFYLQTASAHSRRAIWNAERSGMDAALVSSVFPSQSKSAGRPLGVSRFRSLVANSAIPIYGLGGVSPKNAAQLSDIAGIAAVSAFAD
ncbi:MAG: thiamine phosphate synthase [Pseudomonadota bacterium]